jgi:hypothetical protein
MVTLVAICGSWVVLCLWHVFLDNHSIALWVGSLIWSNFDTEFQKHTCDIILLGKGACISRSLNQQITRFWPLANLVDQASEIRILKTLILQGYLNLFSVPLHVTLFVLGFVRPSRGSMCHT